MKRLSSIAVSRLCPGDVVSVSSRSPLCPLMRGTYGHAVVLTVTDVGSSMTRLSLRFGDVYRTADVPPVHVDVDEFASVKLQRLPDIGDEVVCRAPNRPDVVGVVTATIPLGGIGYKVLVDWSEELTFAARDVAIRRPAPSFEPTTTFGQAQPGDHGRARTSWKNAPPPVDRGLDGEAEEICARCMVEAPPDVDFGDLPRTTDFGDDEGRFACPECGWLGAPRSRAGNVVTVDLRRR